MCIVQILRAGEVPVRRCGTSKTYFSALRQICVHGRRLLQVRHVSVHALRRQLGRTSARVALRTEPQIGRRLEVELLRRLTRLQVMVYRVASSQLHPAAALQRRIEVWVNSVISSAHLTTAIMHLVKCVSVAAVIVIHLVGLLRDIDVLGGVVRLKGETRRAHLRVIHVQFLRTKSNGHRRHAFRSATTL